MVRVARARRAGGSPGLATRAVVAAAMLAAAMLGAGAPSAARAQSTSGAVAITGPAGNPIREGNPRFVLSTSGFLPAELPLQLTLQLSTRADFSAPLLVDTTVTGSSATIIVPRLLPERIQLWWRARARTAQGALSVSDAQGPRTTPSWLTLIAPNGLNGTTVDTKRPTFLWTSAAVLPPLAPWAYHLFITRSADGYPVFNATLSDTVYTIPIELESNTSYRWYVVARLATGDSTRTNSFESFVILDPASPIATNLFQSFPNPFPNERVATTCIWFDLARQAEVRLDVLDIRGNRVAGILPGRGLGPIFPPGRYGRAAVGSDSGCDDRLTWDGRDDAGRFVPSGVYLIRFRGDGVTISRKVLFKGRD